MIYVNNNNCILRTVIEILSGYIQSEKNEKIFKAFFLVRLKHCGFWNDLMPINFYFLSKF